MGENSKKAARSVAVSLGIESKLSKYPSNLSHGERQRVALCRALLNKPSILLADEPTGNLDSKNGFEVMNLLAELNAEGTTIVMVTHSERDAGFATRTIQMLDGKVLSGGNLVDKRKII